MELPDYIKNRYWKDFLPPGISLDIEISEDIALPDIFKKGAESFGDKVSMDFYGREFTFNEINNITRRFANGLSEIGVKKGKIVAIWLPNCPQFTFSYFATLSLGATITAISPLFVHREMAYQIEDSGAKYLILLERFFKQYKRVEDQLSLEKIIIINIEGKKPEIPETDTIIHFNTIMEQYPDPKPLPEVKFNPKEDIAVIQYTGGTTGLPKGACLSHYNVIANVYQIKQVSDYMREQYLKEDLISISVLPWYHIYGQTCELALSPLIGAKAYVFATFDMPKIFEVIKKHKPNTMLGVTTMFINMLNSPLAKDVDFSSLKYANVGAGALPMELAKEWEEKTGFPMGEGYGLSEASPVVTNSPPWAKKKLGSCGHPIANTLVGIINGQLEFLPIGENGELVVSGPQVMLGYHERPEENEKVFFESGGLKWLRTGDFARLDEEGYIFILDRMKDLIKYKGHSVYPREVEEVLFEHPAVMECSVIGVPDPVAGENIMAHIVLRREYKDKVTEEDILAWAKENLAAYKYPRIVKFVRSLPKSAVGKVLRRVIRKKEKKKIKRKKS
ncbi:MAG: long-chain fatty acid--CoA ligase [Promethearchaeota archaeon]|nr:MAG: long-chain fatty acid--CoA ligase [Candidatus Lokiarchaeota archaeon]